MKLKLMVMLISAVMPASFCFADVEIGSHIRTKKVAFISVDVYRFTVSASNAVVDRSSTEKILDQLSSAANVSLELLFLRDVDAKKVSDGFKSGLTENAVSTDSSEIQRFLSAVAEGGEAKKDKKLRIVFSRSVGGESIIFENESSAKKASMPVPAGTSRKVLSIWFGKPADSGLEKLQAAFLGK